jgi:hypothetical protein
MPQIEAQKRLKGAQRPGSGGRRGFMPRIACNRELEDDIRLCFLDWRYCGRVNSLVSPSRHHPNCSLVPGAQMKDDVFIKCIDLLRWTSADMVQARRLCAEGTLIFVSGDGWGRYVTPERVEPWHTVHTKSSNVKVRGCALLRSPSRLPG